jgi:tRNA nucleotidyltransferase (CCA-adding enzyme)
MDKLARERVFDELCKLLPLAKAADLLRYAPILAQVIPELKPSLGFDQRNPHHIHDVFTHTAHVVEATPPEPALRLAALLHDIGKPATFTLDEAGCGHFYGHDELSADMANDILRRLKASNELRNRVVAVIRNHMKPLLPDKRSLRRRMAKYGTEGIGDLLALQRADRIGTGTGDTTALAEAEALIREILAENACLSLKDLAIDGRDLMALGYSGKAIGNCLNTLLEQVLEEQLPNDREALLQAARERKEN